ncbi:MAG: Na(+)/H(+) antiporter subunit C, partial [Syntrophomonadaceae bacterium]|nr:Na(+)/H(+) antiporter subunit C [Syntrophomonadaceae bacterium]
FSDPLPQALLLTAIVINFATTALILVLSYRAYQELKADDMEELRGNINE